METETMSEIASKNFVITHPDDLEGYHQRISVNTREPLEAHIDRDGISDADSERSYSPHDNGEPGSIIGVSMSRAQTYMKSPHTPAHEKVQALEDSRGYFDNDTSATSFVTSPSPDNQVLQSTDTFNDANKDEHNTQTKSKSSLNRRTSLTKAIMAGSETTNRKRSSSGSSGILETIRKWLPDSLSHSGHGHGSKHGPSEVADNSKLKHEKSNTTKQPVVRTRSARAQTMAPPRIQISYADGEENTVNAEPKNRRPSYIRRTTSDNSLYLRKVITGASEFDDYTVYSNVADMPNSRFKAITDSFAETSIKMPKIPFNSTRESPTRVNSDLTKQNTAINAAAPEDPTPITHKDSHFIGNTHRVPHDTKHPILKEAMSQLSGDVVIMGGYRGSVLRSAEPPHHQLWVPIKVGFNLRKVDLEVGLTHEDEETMEERIVPSGMLSHIGPIDISRRLLNKINKCQNVKNKEARIHDWGYDWRLSPAFLSSKLIKYLEGLECNQPEVAPEKRGALVIAHSLGGLITRHAINERPELFSGVIYAGSPQNCCNILGPLRNGDDVLLSSRVLTAQVNFTLRTSYALLPEDGRCFMNKETGERYDMDFFDINTWEEFHLSPCINAPFPPLAPNHNRKGIVGSITESFSSFTPSRNAKRASTFSNSASTDNLSDSPQQRDDGTDSDSVATTYMTNQSAPPRASTSTLREKARQAKDDFEYTARSAGEHINAPREEAQNDLQPTMKSPNAGHHSQKPSIATTVTIPKADAVEYLTRTLAEVKQFKAELAHNPTHQANNKYPPHAIIFGRSVPTVYGAKVANREAIKHSDAYDDLAFAAGDGVVLASAAQLPLGYRCVKDGRVESDRGHIGLLGDLEGIGQCICAVIEGRKRGIGLGNDRLSV